MEDRTAFEATGSITADGRGPDRGHAVVVGGSMAGLLVARVLSGHFRRVAVVERERFPDGTEDRRGVHQGSHAHGLTSTFAGDAASEGKDWGYRTGAGAEEFLERYEDMIDALLQNDVVRGFCYTQLTDIEQEVNGLLTYDRKPKANLARIKDATVRKYPRTGK